MSYIPSKLNRSYSLNGRKFELFSLSDFSFEDNIEITTESGVYCFTVVNKTEIIQNPCHFKHKHTLLYLGKADGRDGINERLRSTHDKFHSLKQTGVNCVGIYKTTSLENPKDVESELLNHYNFLLNTQENQANENCQSNVEED